MVAQSGGPTVAINASLLGIYEKAKQIGVKKVYGACFGVEGLIEGKIVDLDEVFAGFRRNLLMQTPACFLGSCRKRLPLVNDDSLIYDKILNIFKKLDVGAFFYIGGNDSMETVAKMSAYVKSVGCEISIVGVPKTIDNDLFGTDHCPGFGSAAKFVATTFLELERDCSVYCFPAITIVEIMGRDAGWLTAAAALARLNGMQGPNLIYCCEQSFRLDDFFADLNGEIKNKKKAFVLVAVSEGLQILEKSKGFEGKKGWFDEFGHAKNSGVAKFLEIAVKKEFGCKVRSIELSLPQRCCAHLASGVDLQESRQVGAYAVDLAQEGLNGVMATIKRVSNEPYRIEFGFVEALKIAGKVKQMSFEMLSGRNDVSKKAVDYLKPLIQGEVLIERKNGLPLYAQLNEATYIDLE